jgi:hypothetical protein
MDYKLERHDLGIGFDIVPLNGWFNSIGFHKSSEITTLEDNYPANWATIIRKVSFLNHAPSGHAKKIEKIHEQDLVVVPSNIEAYAVAYHLAKRFGEVNNLNLKDCTNYTPVTPLGKDLTEKLDRLIF